MIEIASDEWKAVYKDYRTGKRNLKKGRDFDDWMKVARGYDQARHEAMQRAPTNRPQGAAYRREFAEIDRREKLIDRENAREFPSKEDRTYCIYVLENYDMPSHDPRRPSIKAWRDELTQSERAKLNHPRRVWERYMSATEPLADKDAKQRERATNEAQRDPMPDLLSNTDGERDDARRHAEDARGLLGRVIDEVEDLRPELRDKIKRFLAL